MAVKPMVRRSTVALWYEDEDLSVQLKPYVQQLVYVDHLEGQEPDAIEVMLEDRQRLLQGPLYPRRGAALAFQVGIEGGATFQSGKGFEIDEIELDGPPDVMTLRAVGNRPSSRLHDQVSKAWEGVTLEQIARSIGAAHGLDVAVETGGIALRRQTQHDESDLAFLKRLAADYGLVCSLKEGIDKPGRPGKPTLVIQKAENLERLAPVFELGRTDCSRYRFRNKLQPGSRGAYTRYFDSELKELVEFEIKMDPSMERDPLLKKDRLTIRGRSQQIRTHRRDTRPNMEVHARRALRSSKGHEREATLTCVGNARLRSGVTLALPVDGKDGWGANGGTYLVIHSRHTLDVSGGYTVELTIRKVQK